jgi:hypothetical protein
MLLLFGLPYRNYFENYYYRPSSIDLFYENLDLRHDKGVMEIIKQRSSSMLVDSYPNIVIKMDT